MNIDELILQVLNEEVPVISPITTTDKKQQQQLSPASTGSGSDTTLPKVKLPISLVLLDNMSDLRSMTPDTTHSPTLNSANGPAPTVTLPTSSDYENKCATILDIVRKMVAKHIATQSSSLADGSFTIDLAVCSSDDPDAALGESIDGIEPFFGPGGVPVPSGGRCKHVQAAGERSVKVNWSSLILKIHQSLLQSGLHQQLLKKLASSKSSSEHKGNVLDGLRDKKQFSNVSLSSNSLTSKPDRNVNGGHPEIKSTPITPIVTSPILKETIPTTQTGAASLNSPKASESSGGNKTAPTSPPPSSFVVSKSSFKNNNSGTSSQPTPAPSPSFSLAALMANSPKESALTKGLKEQLDRVQQQEKLATQQQEYVPNNPNMNKLPSQFETDPVLLPDGSEYPNSIPIPNFQNRFPVGHALSQSSSSAFQIGSQPTPAIAVNSMTGVVSPATTLPTMPSSYQGSAGSNFRATFDMPTQSPSGLPPTRLTESFFPTVSSRGPPSFDGIVNQTASMSISPSTRVQTMPHQMPSASPIGSSILVDNSQLIPPPMPISMPIVTNTQQVPLTLSGSTSTMFPPAPSSNVPLVTVVQAPPPTEPAPTIDTMVPASSSFKATHNAPPTISIAPQSIAEITGKMEQTLSEWLDISIYWTSDVTQTPVSAETEKTISDGVNLDLRALLMVERSRSRARHRLGSTQSTSTGSKLVNVNHHEEIAAKFATAILCEYPNKIWSGKKYLEYRDTFVNLRRKFPPTTGPQPGVLQVVSAEEEAESLRLMKKIMEEVFFLISIQHRSSLKLVEKLAIGLLGHAAASVRQEAVKLLNVVYDSHNWQVDSPLKPVIRCIGDAFKVELELEQVLPEEVLKRVYLLTTMPPTTKVSLGLPVSATVTLFSKHKPRVEGTKLTFEASTSFHRAGYYDWRFAELQSNGQFVPFDHQSYRLKTYSSPTPTVPVGVTNDLLIQGRFIVHPKLREEIMHEVWVDLQDAIWDPYRGEISKKGNIQSLIDALDKYHKDGVTTLYVMGILEKVSQAHPFCPTDRDLPNRSLGGIPLFNTLVTKAKQLGIKIVIDSTARLSSKMAHRKYNGSIVHTLDHKGQLSRLEGTDSVEITWPDVVMMNFRKQSVWDMWVEETLHWGERGVDGVRIDSGHTCPLLFRANLDELYRLDSDDLPHFTNQQIFDGEIVMNPSEEGRNFGYWGTTPPSPKQSTPFYPNPLFIKMTREVWNRFPQFVFLAEVYWERELHSIISGLVPYSSAIPRALASVFDKGISKDGIVFDLRQRQSVKALYEYYEMRMSTYPQNSIILFPSSTHHTPYPLQIYNAGAWAAVDALFFLPEIPITYIGEQSGWYYHVDIHSSRVKVGMSSTPYQLQYPQINGHYSHRVTLRKNHTLLRRGGMIPLLCYHAAGWHDRVFGFARFSGDELAIIAINFDNHDTEFYVDCSPLARISTTETIYRMVDLINPSNPPQYLSLQELLYEKHFVSVPGFSSICWGVFHQVNSPAAVRVLYEHSMIRLKQLLADDVDPSHNLIYSILKKGLQAGVTQFATALEEILSNLSGHSERTFASFIQGVLYNMTKQAQFEGYKILSYLEAIAKKGLINSRIPKICKEVLQSNILGPIVFITPEIGRFSTVGGVGVMLDELTRSLQLLGVEVHIISPYYNYGKGGRTGYLEKEEGIKWQRNVVTYVGPDKVEVGVHEGTDRGLHLHFLHHFEYFPTPYNSGSPIHQLKTIVLFAKASLELLCQIRLLPSVIVTNDWFCGLVPGYAKAGAFGTTFNGTTFFHLVHNLEEAYQGRIYPDGNDDLNWIHQLHRDLIMDPHSHVPVLNASRCALLTCNNWGTVSKSYLFDLLRTSHLANLLHQFPQAFAHSNGIRVKERRTQLTTLATSRHEAKALLQKKYFNLVDETIPIFSFVGRIVLQKGVHLILNAMRELIGHYQGKIQVLVGGMANMKDPYASSCAWSMQALTKQFPNSFWADPDAFFSDGALVNLGSDFGLMPSLFEPSGVVQQEYFAAGTPVIAFKTGGLKDTVFEYNQIDETGNGFTFEAHKHTDFVQALHRAFAIYQSPHHYAKIRERSYESVLDMSVVAEAWAKEFSRMRRCIWADKTLIDETCEQLLSSTKIGGGVANNSESDTSSTTTSSSSSSSTYSS
ncbi:hypothetical protein SAMD00019534_108260 [Acytostelium subglobosum LB1]|uniref:hypothetical protein n=1 Tax=Acytostelium subglobosum LB1 TaxID=1410327 RepID=UPI000644D0A6|nr:hypothetical protein SAMD00019534_108260 [Acytostelium subglobosum LB1]GAM27650.1 hypothetical protein SAMD00019534_108260 [Acytostelium subglobosum LB1]|eukprot:XP_012749309.1 hypothetical protein SAMD00019534_108260 [Acytostelium subglobosum LB1]